MLAALARGAAGTAACKTFYEEELPELPPELEEEPPEPLSEPEEELPLSAVS